MVFDWLVLRIPGWNRKIRRMRRDWDDAREKALTKKGRLRKILLTKLDKTEDNLKILEEKPMPRKMRKKISRDIKIDMAEIKIMLKTKEEDMVPEEKTVSESYLP